MKNLVNIKQVILIRRDLKMRRGKEIAQGAHAAMGFLIEKLRDLELSERPGTLGWSEAELRWFAEGMAKICLKVDSEAELIQSHQSALRLGVKSHLIQDSGRTEFHGVPTYTGCAIGPDFSHIIDQITGSLALY